MPDDDAENTRAKIAFANEVLTLLEATPEWSADTLDEISTMAQNLKLAHNDDEGMFTVTR